MEDDQPEFEIYNFELLNNNTELKITYLNNQGVNTNTK